MKKQILKICLIISLLSLCISSAFAQFTFASEAQKQNHYKRLCLMNQKFHAQNYYSVACGNNYHHYNSTSASTYYRGGNSRVRIAEYNLLHPGAMNTQQKDYELLARIMNKWDVVGAVELLTTISEDYINNERVLKFLTGYKEKLNQRKAQLSSEKAKSNPDKARISELEKIIQGINDTYKYSYSLYRTPGYLKLLNELRKIDPSWALILSPSGEAATTSVTQELMGFFYRGKNVTPIVNEYCNAIKTTGDATPFACFPQFDGRFLGRNLQHVFSRRPFMASFKSGNFDFTPLVAHVIYTPPDAVRGKSILKSVFGTSDYRNIGIGVNNQTYARFAEVKVTLDFIEKYKQVYKEQDLIYMGDLNLSARNQYWSELLSEYKNQALQVTDLTTLTWSLTSSNGTATGGLSNDYDHMIVDYYKLAECKDSRGSFNAKALSYLTGTVSKDMSSRYIVRSGSYSGGKFPIVHKELYKQLNDWKESVFINYFITIDSNYVMMRDSGNSSKAISNFKTRVLDSQQYASSYYRVYTEILSDHLPIYMSCNTTFADDD